MSQIPKPQNPQPRRRPTSVDGFGPPRVSTPKTTPNPAFPGVGMTLSSYNHDPFQKMKQTITPKPSRWQRFKSVFSLKRVALTLLALVVVSGGWLGWKILWNEHKLFGGNVFSIFTTTKLKGESSGRVNILLAGNSADDPGHNGANLTDSIMILSVDTQNNTAFMLSVPRDLYVAIPGNGYQKINAAYPDGGMSLLDSVVSQDFGIPIDYNALINYEAIKDAVNDVGGITINIQSSDPRGLYDPDIDYSTGGPLVKLSNGEHTINGEQALDLARARGDAYGSYGFAASDFTRTANQRAMLLALRSKATTAGVLANPVKLGELFDAVGNNVKTDLNLSEFHRLYDITKNISGSNIKSIGLNNAQGQDLLMNYTTSDGESALVPAAGLNDYSDIQQFMEQLTSNNPIVQEGANVVVLNGTTVDGLAGQQKQVLESNNITVSAAADAQTDTQTTSLIIDNSDGKMPATKKELQQLYGAKNITTTNPYASTYPNANFIVIVGTDKESTNSTN